MSRTSRPAALAVGGCALAAISLSPITALAEPSVSAVRHPPQPGLHITGHGYFPHRSGLTVRAPNGVFHIVTRSLHRPGHHRVRMVYLTQRPGQDTWTHHVVPGLRSLYGATEIHLSSSGKRIFVVSYDCDGVYVTDAPVRATTLPRPKRILSDHLCQQTAFRYGWGALPLQRAFALPPTGSGAAGDQIGIMLDDPGNSNDATIFAGNAADPSSFAPVAAVPTDSGAFVPSQAVIDPHTHRITVSGSGFTDDLERVFTVQSKDIADGFGEPVEIARHIGHDPSALFIQTITADRGVAWVGIINRHALWQSHRKHDLYLVRGDRNGHWSAMQALPHTNSNDAVLILATNPKNGHLHAAFTRNDRSSRLAQRTRSGIRVEMQKAGGGWTKPKVISHWFQDRTENLLVTPKGGNTIGYYRIG